MGKVTPIIKCKPPISIVNFVKICNFVKVFALCKAKLLWKSQKYGFGVENTGLEFQTFHIFIWFQPLLLTIHDWNLMWLFPLDWKGLTSFCAPRRASAKNCIHQVFDFLTDNFSISKYRETKFKTGLRCPFLVIFDFWAGARGLYPF